MSNRPNVHVGPLCLHCGLSRFVADATICGVDVSINPQTTTDMQQHHAQHIMDIKMTTLGVQQAYHTSAIPQS